MQQSDESLMGVADAASNEPRRTFHSNLSIENENRFEVVEKLGAGGMGVVYRVLDRELDTEVALKVLTEVSGNRLIRFKNEFRFLTDMVHRNLVTLYDLYSEVDEWYFTMEYISGSDFLESVRPIAQAEVNTESTLSETILGDTVDYEVVRRGRVDPMGPNTQARIDATLNTDRLRETFAQLVTGIDAIHQVGLLHRDIKPSNVIVQPDNRVAVCDFGLVSHRKNPTSSRSSMYSSSTTSERMAGTPVYMAPEQTAISAVVTAACDWYSVGVMLYEALCGQRPHQGEKGDIFVLKREITPIAPKERSQNVPDDLNDLCIALLDRDPHQRPNGQQIFKELKLSKRMFAMPSSVWKERRFVGRQEQLEDLHQAYTDSELGSCVTQFVVGKSGIGKTTLVQRFLNEVTRKKLTFVLNGRCYERESVPYKALDPLIDDLTNIMLEMDPAQVHRILPGEIPSLARLFPSLTTIEPIAVQCATYEAPSDPQEIRKQAFGALRNILYRIAEKQHLVIHTDDLQWGDLDSAYFLRDLIHHGESIPLLLICCVREEEMESSPLINTLMKPDESGVSKSKIRRINLLPLEDKDSFALLLSLLNGSTEDSKWAATIARECQGNPLFIHELARARVTLSKNDSQFGMTDLQEIIRARYQNLPDDAMKLLKIISVAGHRLPVGVPVRACRVKNAALAFARLRHERFVRIVHSNQNQVVEPFHDWIQRSIASLMSDEQRREMHRQLAEAFEVTCYRDTIALVEHWYEAGETQRSGRCALESAKTAEQSAAFRQAAEFYQIALERLDLSDQKRRDILEQMGNALFNAGNVKKAGEVFLEAAKGRHDIKGTELRKQALESMLIGGNLEEGLNLAHRVMHEVGLKMPRTTVGGVFSFLMRRSTLRVRGYDFRKNQNGQPIDRLRFDVELAASLGLTFVNPILSTVLQQRLMLRALKLGDPSRVVLCRAMDIGYRSIGGAKTTASTERFSRETFELAKKTGIPFIMGPVLGMNGVACFLRGQFQQALERFEQGIPIMESNPSELSYFVDSAKNYRMAVWVYLGEMRLLSQMVPIELREALERGDTYFSNTLRSWRSNLSWLVLDLPDAARHQFEQVTQGTISKKFHLHHYFELLSELQIELYKQNIENAWKLIERKWRELESSMVLRIQSIRIESFFLWSRAALAAAQVRPEMKEHLLKKLNKRIRKIRKEKVTWGEGLALMVRGLAAQLQGRTELAIKDLLRAEGECARAGMAMHVAACKLRRGELTGGDQGQVLIQEATDWMKGQNIANPQAFAYLYTPNLMGRSG